MKIVTTVIAALLISGCEQSQDVATVKSPPSTSPATAPTVAPDISTPDRALKSYWRAKDAFRKAQFDWQVRKVPELQSLTNKISIDIKSLTTGDVLSFHEGVWKKAYEQPYIHPDEYSREIEDIKQDTESRATAIVRVRNSTPIPEGVVVSDSDKKRRDEGERLKYVLEKDSSGWKLAQTYKFEAYPASLEGKDQWRKIFSAPVEHKHGSAKIYINEFVN